jgi:WD40 repeat protein
LSGDGQLAVSAGGDGTVRLWETGTGRSVATLEGHTGPVFGVALSRDGRLLVSGEHGGTVRLWDVRTGVELATLRGHAGAVWGASLSDDGQLLATGSFDGTVKLWNTHSGATLSTLRPERRYERLDITGLEGISPAQRQALIALGAVDRLGSPPGSELAGSRAAAS